MTENDRSSHVLVVGTARESEMLLAWLNASENASPDAGDGAGFGSLLSIENVSLNLGSSGALARTRVVYVDDALATSDKPLSVPTAPMNDAPLGTVFVQSRDRKSPVDRIIVTGHDLDAGRMLETCLSLLREGHNVLAASPAFGVIKRNGSGRELNGLQIVPFRPTELRGWRCSVKRIIDVVGAVVGGVVLIPVFLVTAVAIKLTSPGPVFFKQTRIGKGGGEFTFYKFRSMVSGDDSKYKEYLKAFVEDGREAAVDSKGRKVYKIMDDPRITTFGRFLRRTSLDEFPQIINVLKGEMSLVGPRPCLPYEWDLYEDWEKARLSVTPGLTGLWQVTGRSNVTFHDMVLLDLYYISNWSFWWDLKLIFQTIPVILLGKGAH